MRRLYPGSSTPEKTGSKEASYKLAADTSYGSSLIRSLR